MDGLTMNFVDEQRRIEEEKRLKSKNFELLEKLEREFKFLWDKYERNDWKAKNLGDYCAHLESAIMSTIQLFRDEDVDAQGVITEYNQCKYPQPSPGPIIPLQETEVEQKEMPNPTEQELNSPEFNAIWEVIQDWDVNVPEYYEGYCGANGSHVKLILDRLKQNQTKSKPKY